MIYVGFNRSYIETPLSVWSAMRKSNSFINIKDDALNNLESNGWGGGASKEASCDYKHNKTFKSFDDAKKYAKRVAKYIGGKAYYNLPDNRRLTYNLRGMPYVYVFDDINGITVHPMPRLLNADDSFYHVVKKGYSNCCICKDSIPSDSDYDDFTIISAKVKKNYLAVEVLCKKCASNFNTDNLRIGRNSDYAKEIINREDLLVNLLSTRKG